MDLQIKKINDSEGYIYYKDWGFPVEVVNGELKSIALFWDKCFMERLCFEIPELTQDELAEYCKGICQAEEFLLEHLKSQFNTTEAKNGLMFSLLPYWGFILPQNEEFSAEDIRKLSDLKFDTERDILFLFNWFDSAALECHVVYSVPERVIKERKNKMYRKYPIKVTSTPVKYQVEVWQPGDEEPTIYEDMEEVNWNMTKGVVEMKRDGETIKLPADNVAIVGNLTQR